MRYCEQHHLAKLTDHEVELIRLLLLERRMLVALLRGSGVDQVAIDRQVREASLSYAAIGRKFESRRRTCECWALRSGGREAPLSEGRPRKMDCSGTRR